MRKNSASPVFSITSSSRCSLLVTASVIGQYRSFTPSKQTL